MKYIQKYEREEEQNRNYKTLKIEKFLLWMNLWNMQDHWRCYERELDLSISEKYLDLEQ